MATNSPSPNSSPSSPSPTSTPQASSPDTNATASPPPTPDTNATSPPPPTPDANAKSPQSPPNLNATSPSPPLTPSASPPPSSGNSPPIAPTSPPPTTSPPPPLKAFVPPSQPSSTAPPPPSESPPPPPKPPTSSPPPPSKPTPSPPPASPKPSPPPPKSSPPPPESKPPASPPPPSQDPPSSPPPQQDPPAASPPPESPSPPEDSPSPPSTDPPQASPPPRTPTPPKNSPPSPPSTNPPENSPPSPPPGVSDPPSSSQSPPTEIFTPPLSPSELFIPPPSSQTTTNSSSGNAREIAKSSGNKGLITGAAVAVGLVVGLAVLGLVAFAVFFVRRRKKRTPRTNGGLVLPTYIGSSPHSDAVLLKGSTSASTSNFVSTSESEALNPAAKRNVLGNSRAWFTYEELVEATNGFSEENLLGEGGFGYVYKGQLPDGKEVAVKQLKIHGGQGEKEFEAEVEIISRIHHRHLVSLVGCCIWETGRLLVFDFVPNNTLHFHLHGEGRPVMEWVTRVKVAVGAARGLAYLHEDCHPKIIHRDIKSSNILLDNNFEARVSDFGLAKLAGDANSHITTRVVGTFGYMAPEYASTGKLTEKSDIYSFGVVLLELITGRRPVDTSQPIGEESLVEWARPLLNLAVDTEEFERLADPRLDKNYVGSEMLQIVEVAAACVRHSAAKRPRMGQVLRAFESMVTSDITNGVPVGDSEIYNTPPQSSEIRWFRRMAFGNQDFSTDFFSQTNSMNRTRSFADAV